MARERRRRQGKHYLRINQLDIDVRIEFPSGPVHNRMQMEEKKLSTRWPVAVVMTCRTLSGNRWQTEQWEASDVVLDPAATDFACNDNRRIWPDLEIRLYRDEAEGYLYNIQSPEPKVFVMWRMHDNIAKAERVTVSYHEGARWMDSDEKVDGVPLPPALVPWIRAFAELHYRPEPKKAKRYATSKDRGRMGNIG
jgi:hypothetical protein